MLARIEDTKLKPIGPYFVGQVVGYVDRQQELTDRCTVAGAWYVVNFEPKQGKRAKTELAEAGLVPYLPLTYGPERHGRGAVRSGAHPMFGCYMFVRCEPKQWGLATVARGVRRLLGLDGQPFAVKDGEIEAIRLQETISFEEEARRIGIEEVRRLAHEKGKSGIVWQFSPGDHVRIKNGPFAGFYAQLESAVDSNDRLKALVSLFGGTCPADFSAFDIEAL